MDLVIGLGLGVLIAGAFVGGYIAGQPRETPAALPPRKPVPLVPPQSPPEDATLGILPEFTSPTTPCRCGHPLETGHGDQGCFFGCLESRCVPR